MKKDINEIIKNFTSIRILNGTVFRSHPVHNGTALEHIGTMVGGVFVVSENIHLDKTSVDFLLRVKRGFIPLDIPLDVKRSLARFRAKGLEITF